MRATKPKLNETTLARQKSPPALQRKPPALQRKPPATRKQSPKKRSFAKRSSPNSVAVNSMPPTCSLPTNFTTVKTVSKNELNNCWRLGFPLMIRKKTCASFHGVISGTGSTRVPISQCKRLPRVLPSRQRTKWLSLIPMACIRWTRTATNLSSSVGLSMMTGLIFHQTAVGLPSMSNRGSNFTTSKVERRFFRSRRTGVLSHRMESTWPHLNEELKLIRWHRMKMPFQFGNLNVTVR